MKTFSQLAKDSWSIFTHNWQRFVSLGILAVIIGICLELILVAGGLGYIFSTASMQNLDITVLEQLLLQLAPVIILTALLIMLFNFAIKIAMYHACPDKAKDVGKILLSSFKSYLPALALLILSSLILTAGYIVFIIPGIILTIYFSLIFPVLILERTGPIKAMARSYALVKGHWWQVTGRVVLFALCLMGLGVLLAICKLSYLMTFVSLIAWPIFTYCIYKELAAIKENHAENVLIA